MRPRTLLRVLLTERGCGHFATFEEEFTRSARQAAVKLNRPDLATVTASQATWKRWLSGDQTPRSDAAAVLEFMLGVDVETLLRTAAERGVVLPEIAPSTARDVARFLNARFDTSHLNPMGRVPGMEGVWHLEGQRFFDGTSVAVQIYEATEQDGRVVIGPHHHPHIQAFTRATRRALVLGALGDDGLYALDAAHARRQLAVTVETLPISTPYEIDDLTYGLLWAMLNLDDSLSADDHALHAEQQMLEPLWAQRRSAVARAAIPELTNVGSVWLGMYFCAEHIIRRLDEDTRAPVFWTPVRTGEEAAVWLFFASWPQFRLALRERLADGDPAPERVFCIPEDNSRASQPYERILIWLTVAMMERGGQTTWVCVEPRYERIDGFVLVPGRRVISASWSDSSGIWHVDTTDSFTDVSAYAQVVDHARRQSVTSGDTSEERLRSLADHLDLDWDWLVRRCRELGAYGIAGMLRPRSRLISVEELEQVLCYVGEFDAD
ncbi:hypothetical protein CCS38_15715 [Streptomyces purpurogeneiscleroticus]|nr:hypothetical protein [Streptomyces purpurogeneiscleroticus]